MQNMKNILIIGATSAIAQSTARLFAKNKAKIYLVGRNRQKIESVKQDLQVHGATELGDYIFDINNIPQHSHLIYEAEKFLHKIDCVLIAHGTLSDQNSCQRDFDSFQHELCTNFTSVASLLTILANKFESQKSGTIVVISSVAGDRGRKSNYVYGTAKGALTIFLQGLRNRLCASNVNVLTVKPGFTDTPMTANMKKGPLWATSDKVAADIYKAIQAKKDVIYTPWFWRYIMLIIRHIPEAIFKKLSL